MKNSLKAEAESMSMAAHKLPSDKFADPSHPGNVNISAVSQVHFRHITSTSYVLATSATSKVSINFFFFYFLKLYLFIV